MSKFYAKFVESPEEIAVFSSKDERDKWVNFKDEFSVAFKTTPENCIFNRMAITPREARELAGNNLYKEKYRSEDMFLPGVYWITTRMYFTW